MIGRGMDWLDWFTGYDRLGVRVLLFIVAVNAIFLCWLAYDEWVKPTACDATCRAAAQQFISDHPELFTVETVPPLDLSEFR